MPQLEKQDGWESCFPCPIQETPRFSPGLRLKTVLLNLLPEGVCWSHRSHFSSSSMSETVSSLGYPEHWNKRHMCVLFVARNNISACNFEEIWSVGTAKGLAGSLVEEAGWVGSDVNNAISNGEGMLQKGAYPPL